MTTTLTTKQQRALGALGATAVMCLATLIGRHFSSVFDAYCYLLYIGAKGIGVTLTMPLIRLLRRRTLPAAPTAISCSWLNVALKCGDNPIVKIDSEQFAEKGRSCASCRLHLTYEKGAPDRPQSMVVKMSQQSFIHRCANLGSNSISEIEFYRLLAPTLPLQTPKCWHSEMDPYSHDFLLLLEDINGSTLLPMEKVKEGTHSVPIPLLQEILKGSAAMHATYWADQELLEDPKFDFLENRATRQGKDRTKFEVGRIFLVQGAWSKTKMMMQSGRWGEPWADDFTGLIEETITHLFDWEWNQKVARLYPFTIRHGDFHGWNILQRNDAAKGAESYCVIDWQSVGVAEGIRDPGYLITFALNNEDRRLHERELIEWYWTQLVQAPGSRVSEAEYPLELAWERYKFWGSVSWIFIIAVMSQLVVEGVDTAEETRLMQMIVKKVKAFIEVHGKPQF
jgi:hypothetical protein